MKRTSWLEILAPLIVPVIVIAMWFLFWGTVAYVAWHFLSKIW